MVVSELPMGVTRHPWNRRFTWSLPDIPPAAISATTGEKRMAMNGFQPRLCASTAVVLPPTAKWANWAKEYLPP